MKTSKPREKKGKYLILPEEFDEKGFTFKQIERKVDAALYEKVSKTSGKSWEVIKINRHEGYIIAGNEIPPAEVYPSSEQWGTNGWSYSTLDAAKAKLKTISKK